MYLVSFIFAFFFSTQLMAAPFDTEIQIVDKGSMTYYVPGYINGYGRLEFMVDTGSGHTAINQKTLNILRKQGKASYIESIHVALANGSHLSLPTYKIDSINLGGHCEFKDIIAVVLPGLTRNILGLSTLKMAAPFAMSISPPTLMLSGCQSLA